MLVVVVVFSSLEIFTFPGYFFLPPALSSALTSFSYFTFCQAFPSQIYHERYSFE